MGAGWYHCNECREKFTVRVGTLYERSHIPLHKWLLATHLVVSSKKGMSAHQLHRMLGITYKSAWFMAHRIREAMKPEKVGPLGGYAHVNTAECRFSIMKRAVYGTHHAISEAHLHRYLVEWDFKYNTRRLKDGERAAIALKGIEGKRLTYRSADKTAHA